MSAAYTNASAVSTSASAEYTSVSAAYTNTAEPIRVLAIFCGAFSAGIFLAQYLLSEDWLLPCSAAAFCLACTRLFLPCAFLPSGAGRRVLLIGTGLSLALGWNWLYIRQVSAPARALAGTEQEVEMVLQGYPRRGAYGVRCTVAIEGVPGRAVWYGDWAAADLRPGQTVRDTVRFRDAARVREDDLTVFTSRGVFLLAYGQGKLPADGTASVPSAAPSTDEKAALSFGEGTASSPRWYPARLGHAAAERIQKLLRGDEAAFLTALLTGDRSGLSVTASADLEEAGLSHVLAVSGMHCGFLLAALALMIGRHRRRLLALCAVPVLLFYAALTGGSPSVVRACIMLFFLLAAPLFDRESDGPTSLSAALFLLLLHNPFAAASVSLQLSFASVAGLLWISPGVYRFLMGQTGRPAETIQPGQSAGNPAGRRGKKPAGRRSRAARYRRRVRAFLAANVSASLGALALTAPLTAYYFGTFPLIAPLSGVLCLWAAGAAFATGLLSVTVSFLLPSLGTAAACVPGFLIRYILSIAHALAHVPGHAVYFVNPYLKVWLAYGYLLLLTVRYCAVRRRAALAAVLLPLTLLCAVWVYRGTYRHGIDAVMLDVGQGQSVALSSAGRYALADCGSGNSWYDAGALAARQLKSLGCRRLDVLLLSHFDTDHVNGVESLLARLPVGELLIPGTGGGEDTADSGPEASIRTLAERYGVPVRTVTAREELPFGNGTLTVFPPLGTSGDNDRGLTVLASVGEADFLITGDMGSSTERKLLAAFPLPDLEALAAGHHGSKYSTSDALLDALTPETAVISVGSNSYGHPSPETLERLEAHGCTVYRTDRDGNIHLALDG